MRISEKDSGKECVTMAEVIISNSHFIENTEKNRVGVWKKKTLETSTTAYFKSLDMHIRHSKHLLTDL